MDRLRITAEVIGISYLIAGILCYFMEKKR